MFLFQKAIDRSTLWEGFQIPKEYRELLMASPGGVPQRGESFDIKIVIDGIPYDALLKNQRFDENVYDHLPLIQIRYNKQSPLAKKLREVFHSTFDYVETIKAQPENSQRKFTIKVPEARLEYLAISTTDLPNVFVADCITCGLKAEISNEVHQMNELDFETAFEAREDATAGIREVTRVQRIRHLDHSNGDSLKRLYDYRCQMTGEKIGDQYNALVVEAHHIIPFTESLNNDTSNIIILSPSYHRIIHRAKPEWDSRSLSFHFPNGLVETVKLDKHLKL